MDPEELESIPLDDGADLEAIPMDEGRPRATRRTVLGADPSQDRIETGHVVDADSAIDDAPTSQKLASTGPTAQQRDWWEDRETDRELSRTSAAGDTARTILGLLPGARGLSPDIAAAPGRLASRAQRAGEQWVETVGNEARPPDQSSGRDRRAEAMPAAMAEVMSFNHADELAGLARSDPNPDSYRRERDRARAERLDAQGQAPGLYGAGEVAGTAAMMALPNPATVGGRMAAGLGLGALSASGASEADFGTADHLQDTAIGGALGLGAAGLAEGASQVLNPSTTGRVASRLERSADRSQRVADQARLEASGVWGGRAMRAADELPGGQERLAADLRRMQIGQRGDFSIPRMQRAAEDAETLRRASGSSLGSLIQNADDSGAMVSTLGARQRVEQLAQELDRLPVGGRQAAEQLRQIAGDLANAGDMTPSDAWAQRQLLDDMIGGYQRDPNLAALSGRLSAVRRALSDELGNTMASAGMGPQWAHGSRDYQVGAFMRDHGRGQDRLSVGGGMGGANAAGDLVAQAMQSGSPLQVAAAVPSQMAARHLSQETRMAFPGVRARIGEASADAQRAGAGALRSLSSAGSDGARRILDTMGRAGAARGGSEVGEARSETRASQDAGAWLSETLRTNPQALGQYAEHFQDADPQEVARIHFQLSQSDPGYRAQIARARAEER